MGASLQKQAGRLNIPWYQPPLKRSNNQVDPAVDMSWLGFSCSASLWNSSLMHWACRPCNLVSFNADVLPRVRASPVVPKVN